MANAVLHLIRSKSPDDHADFRLTEEEKERSKRFVFPEDAARWSGYRSGLRRILGLALDIEPLHAPLKEGPNGKPALAPPFECLEFNLSHSDEFAVVIVSDAGPVGIDLEPWSRAPSLIGCEEVFCHPLEIQELPTDHELRATRLLELWTAKEAILKALGTGLSYPPQQVRISNDRALADTPLDGISNLRLLIPNHPEITGHRVAVAIPHTIDGIDWNFGRHQS